MRAVQFFSSVSGSAFWRRLLGEIEEAGWSAREVYTLSNLEYGLMSGPLAAWRLRWRMYVLFAWRAACASRDRRGRPVQVVTTNPFFAPWLVLKMASGGVPVVNLLYDLFPDALEVAGILRPHSLASEALSALTRSTLGAADATVFLGDELKRHVEARYGPARRSWVIPVGADGAPFAAYPPRPLPRSEPAVLLYCGLMGKMHDVETLAQVIQRPSSRTACSWVFHASGSGYQHLRDAVAHSTASPEIRWGTPLAEEAWIDRMRSAHVGVVTMASGRCSRTRSRTTLSVRSHVPRR